MTFFIKGDEESEKAIRGFKNNPAFKPLVEKSVEKAKHLAVEIIGELEKGGLNACPCILSDLLRDLNAEQLQGAILVLARIAAVKKTISENEKPFVVALDHLLARRDEMLSDQTLSADEIAEQN